jgi:hypothetical protein
MGRRTPYSDKTGTMMVAGSQQSEIVTQLMAAGLECRPWKERIYINGSGDTVSIYLQLSDPTQPSDGAPLHVGVRLFVWVNDRTMTPLRRVQKAKQVKHETWAMLHRLGIQAAPPPADWNQVQL